MNPTENLNQQFRLAEALRKEARDGGPQDPRVTELVTLVLKLNTYVSELGFYPRAVPQHPRPPILRAKYDQFQRDWQAMKYDLHLRFGQAFCNYFGIRDQELFSCGDRETELRLAEKYVEAP